MSVLVEVTHAAVRAGVSRILEPASIAIESGQIWAFLGGNGSGKTVLSELVSGRRPPASGEVRFGSGMTPRDIQILSFEEQTRLIERERRKDESRLMHGGTDMGTTVRQFVSDKNDAAELLDRFHLTHRADAGLRFLSTGELRKAILCRAIASRPALVILDDPYDGLDVKAQEELRSLIPTMASEERAVILVLSREPKVSAAVTHVAYLADCRLLFAGTGARFASWLPLAQPDFGPVSHRPLHREPSPAYLKRATTPKSAPIPGSAIVPEDEALIRMENVSVRYGRIPVLHRIGWQVHPGESWQIVGPNGAGKSTLLSLVSAGNTKAYGQQIWLFGRKRGSGESVWDIKRRIGLISGDFHGSYPLRTTALEAVLSGFSDSAGLYEPPSGYQREVAATWLDIIGLEDHAERPLRRLSYGEQRAVLVARAMVKSPPLLIADEPCQGLDDRHTERVMSLLERISLETKTCLLYVSHDPALTLASATHRLTLVPGDRGSAAIREGPSFPA